MVLFVSAGFIAVTCLGSFCVQDPQHSFAQSSSKGLSTVRGVLVDVNRDGKLDAINGGVFNIALLRGWGNGFFETEQLFSGAFGLFDLTAGDVNLDGFPDLVASGFSEGKIRMLLGNGNGFSSAVSIQQALQCRAVLLADLDQDGDADLAYTARTNPGLVNVLAGNGAGVFSPASSLPLPSAEPVALAKGEFTGDGVNDLIVGGSVPGGGFVTVLSGASASLQFSPLAATTLPANVPFIRSGDLNGDALTDVAYTMTGGIPISIALGAVGGALTPAPSLLGNGPAYAPEIGDVDADGIADLAAVRTIAFTPTINYGESHLYRGLGAGAFGQPEIRPVGSPSGFTLFADVSRDGFMDIVTMGSGTGLIETAVNDRSGGFHPGNAPIALVGGGFERAIVGDFNNDQKPDAAVSFLVDVSRIDLFLNSGSGMQLMSSTSVDGLRLLDGDFNGDGNLDLGSYNGSGFFTALGDGAGGLQPLPGVTIPPQGAYSGRDVRFADLNGDGALDALLSEGIARQLHVVLGNGFGSFVYSNAVPAPVGVNMGDIAFGDFSGDGIPDAVVGGFGPSVHSYQGQGSAPFFAFQSILAIQGFSSGVGAADLNADGLQDFVLTGIPGLASGTTTILRGVGATGLQVVQTAGLSTFFGTPIFEDYDFDGNLDFAVLDTFNSIQVFLGDGTGAAVAANRHASVARSTAANEDALHGLFGGDWNGDGLQDVSAVKAGAVIPFLRTLIPPAGIERYGASTAGCDGSQRLDVQQSPEIGNAGFELHCTNAPANSMGLVLLSDSLDVPGSDPFGIFVNLHVDLFAATQSTALDMSSNSAGHAMLGLPIPNVAALASQTFGIQALWAWSPTICTPTPFGLSTSDALQLTPLN